MRHQCSVRDFIRNLCGAGALGAKCTVRHQCRVREWRFLLLPVNYEDHAAFRSYSYTIAFALNVVKHYEGTHLSDVMEIFGHHGLRCALLWIFGPSPAWWSRHGWCRRLGGRGKALALDQKDCMQGQVQLLERV